MSKYFINTLIAIASVVGIFNLHAGEVVQSEGEYEMENKRVLISGGGIAGLTLAFWLKKHGFTPTIIEKYPELRTGGYKIDIRGVALDIIKQMDAYSTVFEQRTEIRGATILDSSLHSREMDADLCGGRVEGDLEILRGDLCVILYEQLGEIECLFGDSISGLSQDDAKVLVEFEKGSPREFDLVIGADGLHSNVRKLIFGEESQFLKELGFYISVYSAPNFLKLDRWEIEYFEPQKFLNVYSSRGDQNATVGLAFASAPNQLEKERIETKQSVLKNVFGHIGGDVPQLLLEMDQTSDFYFDTVGQIKMSTWSDGRVALVGDAGYGPSPFTGQGSSVALVGAYVLAGELANAHGDYKAAFQAYEVELREFTNTNQELVKMTVTMMGKDDTSWKVWLTQRLMRLLPMKVIQICKTWGTARINKAANSIELKDYSKSEQEN